MASAEGECGGQGRRASAEAQQKGLGGWGLNGESGGRVRRARAEGECGVPMKNPPLSGGLVSVRSEAAREASGNRERSERFYPTKNPPCCGGLVSVRSEAASVASGHTPLYAFCSCHRSSAASIRSAIFSISSDKSSYRHIGVSPL